LINSIISVIIIVVNCELYRKVGGVTLNFALLIVEIVLGLAVIVSILAQPSKSDALSGLIQGSSNETFYSKNKARTKDVMLMRLTGISMFLFAVNTIVLSII
jgi:preprotein translocase subunit SecG